MVTLYYGYFSNGVTGSRYLIKSAETDREESWTLTRNAYGKPLISGGPEISISHTKGAAAVVVSSRPAGVDIERIRSVLPNLPKRVMSHKEYQWFDKEGKSEEAFFTLWTLKESYYKYLGTGLPGFPNQTNFYRECGTWHLEGSQLVFSVFRAKEYVIALCSEDHEIRIIQQEEN